MSTKGRDIAFPKETCKPTKKAESILAPYAAKLESEAALNKATQAQTDMEYPSSAPKCSSTPSTKPSGSILDSFTPRQTSQHIRS